MNGKFVPAPVARRPWPARGVAPTAPRRYLPTWLAATIGALVFVAAAIVIILWIRKPADPELLRPARAAATVVPMPSPDGSYTEYRGQNVIIRFNQTAPAQDR